MSKRVLAWVAAALCAGTAWAEDWQTVAELTAGGGTHEVALDRTVRVIGIEGVSGAATVAAVVVREGEAENPVAVERAFPPGEVQDIDLGYDRQVTGLLVRDGGRGVYRIRVK